MGDVSEPWRALVHDPKIIRGFETTIGTTVLASGIINIQLPKPSTINLDVEIPKKWKKSARVKYYGVSAFRMVKAGEGNINFEIAGNGNRGVPMTNPFKLSNLAPASYWVSVGEVDPATSEAVENPGSFRESIKITTTTGETTTTVLQYRKLDTSLYKGSGKAIITVKNQRGEPASGLPFALNCYDTDFGNIYLTSGTLSDAGTTTISDLAQGKESPAYLLFAGENLQTQIGAFNLGENETSNTFTFTLPPQKGDLAPDISLVDPVTSKTVRLSDFRGQLVYLDFWATWCGPCQAPMAHNQKLMVKHKDDWKGKVVIIGASIDDASEDLVQRINDKGWTDVRQLWCRPEKKHFRSKAAQTYKINMVPTSLLIDANGEILWRGHPDFFELENEIQKALRGSL